jgi:aldehyde:ferredoxin oxidoreductase
LAPAPDDFSAQRLSVFKMSYCLNEIKDCMVMCSFPPSNYERTVELIKAVTGWNTSYVELIKIGERVWNLMRLFNIREGFTSKDDDLPQRFYGPKTDGVLSNKAVDKAAMDKAKGYYYFFMGWDEKGVPRTEKLAELGIEV